MIGKSVLQLRAGASAADRSPLNCDVRKQYTVVSLVGCPSRPHPIPLAAAGVPRDNVHRNVSDLQHISKSKVCQPDQSIIHCLIYTYKYKYDITCMRQAVLARISQVIPALGSG